MMMPLPRSTTLAALSIVTLAGCARATAQQPPTGGAPPQANQQGQGQGQNQQRRGPRPYDQVITKEAVSDTGGITVHRVNDDWFFEIPDSLVGRDFLLVSRIAEVPSNFGGFLSAGTSLEERLVRFVKNGDRMMLESMTTGAYAPDSLPIAISVRNNNSPTIMASFPAAAYTADSASMVVEVTDFFSGDTPGIGGLSAAQRRTYQVRRLDPARSFVNYAKSFPLNVEVRHTQTFEAGAPPADRSSGAISLVMRQSLVLLPREPMRPRYADERVGFFAVERVNYGLDEQKAATQRFIRRWRLEPKDPAAYARGELVEPVKPIVYYIDPATPTKWRPYVRAGILAWNGPFEKAGFRNAVVAMDSPSPEEDPDWDPEDIRYSVVRWAASTTRNAVGPSTSDPRTGEIIESDITWYHNHMRSYRNRLMVETAASNPAARTLEIPESLMGETMTQVITHEIGHAIGLPHNMVASSSFPVDSLRSPTFTTKYGVSATIMDYARQNYIAQPGDGLAPNDYIRRLGPFDDFAVNWGYRVLPDAPTPDAELPTLNNWITSQTGMFAYRFVPQRYGSVDPRAQTEDLGDDPVRASTYAITNLKKVVPMLPEWTTAPGKNYDDLAELHGEAVSMWSRYMGHVVTLIGGVTVDSKTADQAGPVFHAIPKARQEAALEFLDEQVFDTPEWLTPDSITSRIGPVSVASRQASIVNRLLDTSRLDRMADLAAQSDEAYSPTEYMGDLRRALWGTPGSVAAPDANRRYLQRAYLERLATIIKPPEPEENGNGGFGGGGGGPPPPLLAPPDVPRSDLPALARSQLSILRDQVRRAAGNTPAGIERAHWQDIEVRIDAILDPGVER